MLTPTLQRDEGWLLFAALVPGPGPRDPEQLLAWSGELPGGCKFAYGTRAELRVQAELPAPAENAERLAAVEAGFATAAAQLGLAVARAEPEATCTAERPDLAALCREAGWPFEERADGSLAVDIAVPGAYVPALVEARADRIAVEAEIARMPETDGPCHAALAVLLLRVNGAFRMVRAVQRAPESRALLEVSLSRTLSAAELGEALAALAVAARHCALEARLLASDIAIARTFLDRSGMLPPL